MNKLPDYLNEDALNLVDALGSDLRLNGAELPDNVKGRFTGKLLDLLTRTFHQGEHRGASRFLEH